MLHWVPGSEQLWEHHISTPVFIDGLPAATWQSRADPDALNTAVEGFLVQEALCCRAAHTSQGRQKANPTKLLL